MPQPVVSLIEVLLDKDPKRRFQTPADLLKALPTITGAIDEGRTITYQRLGQMPDGKSYSVTRKPPARLEPEKISIARLPVTGSDLFGREEDIAFLDEAWANQRINVVTIVAWAGVGKSTLSTIGSGGWLPNIIALRSSFLAGPSTGRVAVWAPPPQMNFLMLLSVGLEIPIQTWEGWQKGEKLAKLVSHRRSLQVLDGLETLRNPPGAKRDDSVNLPSRHF